MRRLIALGLLLAAVAQGGQQTTRTITQAYDLSSTSYTFPLMAANATAGGGTVTTAGSSTTVTAGTANSFSVLAVGDTVNFASCSAGTGEACTRVVRTAGATTIVVDSVITIATASTWTWIDQTDGTGANQGWLNVSGFNEKTLWFEITTITAASIEAVVQCKSMGVYATANQVWPGVSGTVNLCSGGTGSFTAAGKCAVSVPEPWDRCRIGFKVTTDGGSQSITAGAILLGD
jgi:hypothetical protein